MVPFGAQGQCAQVCLCYYCTGVLHAGICTRACACWFVLVRVEESSQQIAVLQLVWMGGVDGWVAGLHCLLRFLCKAADNVT